MKKKVNIITDKERSVELLYNIKGKNVVKSPPTVLGLYRMMLRIYLTDRCSSEEVLRKIKKETLSQNGKFRRPEEASNVKYEC